MLQVVQYSDTTASINYHVCQQRLKLHYVVHVYVSCYFCRSAVIISFWKTLKICVGWLEIIRLLLLHNVGVVFGCPRCHFMILMMSYS